jgi:hypothetical protein
MGYQSRSRWTRGFVLSSGFLLMSFFVHCGKEKETKDYKIMPFLDTPIYMTEGQNEQYKYRYCEWDKRSVRTSVAGNVMTGIYQSDYVKIYCKIKGGKFIFFFSTRDLVEPDEFYNEIAVQLIKMGVNEKDLPNPWDIKMQVVPDKKIMQLVAYKG